MKRYLIYKWKRALACVCTLLLVAGCAALTAEEQQEPVGKYNGRALNILISMGGLGNYYEPVVGRMFQLYPGLTVNLSYESSAHEILPVTIAAGNMPDIFNINQGLFRYEEAIAAGHCLNLEDVLRAPTMDESATLLDILDPYFLEKGVIEGQHYLISEAAYISGLWYDADLLDRYALSPPQSWGEFDAVAETLQRAGIPALGYCGEMASEYALCYLFLPMLKNESEQAFAMLDAGDPVVFNTPAMHRVVQQLEHLRDKGFFATETLEMSNLATQSLLTHNGLGFYPCGSWLATEITDTLPEDFTLALMPVPSDNPVPYLFADSLISGVSAETANVDLVAEFYRIMFSDPPTLEAQVRIHRNRIPIAHFTEQYGYLLSRSNSAAWEWYDRGEVQLFFSRLYLDNTAFSQAAGNALNALLAGNLDTNEFCETLAAALV